MNIDELVRQRVILARESADIDRKDVAAALELTENSYGHYERGRSPFTVAHVFSLARLFHRPATWFLGIDDPKGEARRVAELWRALPPDQQKIITTILQDMVENYQSK